MDVSVVIPTYNRPDLLKDTIDSVMRQTVAAREIIVVDNGTGDETGAMLTATYGSSVIYVRELQRGVQAARNAGVERAQGTWIATLDDDDIRDPEFLEQMRPAVKDGRANLIFSDHRKFVDTATKRIPYHETNFEAAPPDYWDDIPRAPAGRHWSFVGKFPPERLLRFNAFYPSTMLARKDLIQAVGGYNPEIYGTKAEDIEFLVRALHQGDLAIVWSPLVYYRIHETNSCGGDWVSQMIGRWRIFEYINTHGAYGCKSLQAALQEDLPERRVNIFDQAWRYSRFDVMDELKPLLRDEDWTWLRQLRLLIRNSPTPVRAGMMQLRGAFALARGARVSVPGAGAPMTSLAVSSAQPG